MRAALDTNVLAYVEGVNGPSMKAKALDVVHSLSRSSVVLPVQTLGELFHLLMRKARFSPRMAEAAILTWHDAFPVIATSPSVMLAAANLAADHQLRIWDAIIVATAAEADCRLLLSEDLQDGFTWSGVTVTNPFAKRRHPLLDGLLRDQS